jgi:hypothetical protein
MYKKLSNVLATPQKYWQEDAIQAHGFFSSAFSFFPKNDFVFLLVQSPGTIGSMTN